MLQRTMPQRLRVASAAAALLVGLGALLRGQKHLQSGEPVEVHPLSPVIFTTVLEEFARPMATNPFFAAFDYPYDELFASDIDGSKPRLSPSNQLFVDLDSQSQRAALQRHREELAQLMGKSRDEVVAVQQPLLYRNASCRALLSAVREIGINGAFRALPYDKMHYLGQVRLVTYVTYVTTRSSDKTHYLGQVWPVTHVTYVTTRCPDKVHVSCQIAAAEMERTGVPGVKGQEVTAHTRDRPISVFGGVSHGIIWHRLAVKDTLSRKELWHEAFVASCPFAGISASFYYACLHGAGHGALLHMASHDVRSGVASYARNGCSELGHQSAAVEWPTVERALALCEYDPSLGAPPGVTAGITACNSAGNSAELTHGCLSWLYHQLFAHFARPGSMPRISWLSPCDAPLVSPANCFVWLWATGVPHVLPAMEALPGRISDACVEHVLPTERHVLGCVYGLAQAFYPPFEARRGDGGNNSYPSIIITQ